MRHLLASFTPEQLERYECFRRSTLNRKTVRKVVGVVTGNGPKEAALIVIAGLAKTFVGDLVEEGLRVQAEREEEGPLRPSHVREAHRRLFARGASLVMFWTMSCRVLTCDVCIVTGKVFSSAARPSPMGARGAAARTRL
jgi:transcription initiation factor TFIID subunit 11